MLCIFVIWWIASVGFERLYLILVLIIIIYTLIIYTFSNELAEVIATTEATTTSKSMIQFNTADKYTPLMTKCELFDKKNTRMTSTSLTPLSIWIISIIIITRLILLLNYHIVMISTEVEDIDGAKGFWKTIQPFLLIGLLVYIVKYFWDNRP